MTINNLFLDMDGVFCDFGKKYVELFGKDNYETQSKKIKKHCESRNNKESNVEWKEFCQTKQFENLDWWPGAHVLLSKIDDIHKRYPDLNISFLTSTGGQLFHDSVKEQKTNWLKKKNINYPAIFVPGRSNKKKYADKYSVLIDDTEDVIESWLNNGGIGILHRDIKDTLDILDNLFP